MNEHKVAVISGAAQGIGKAYAKRLAQDGFDTVLVDLGDMQETQALVEAEGRTVLAQKCDISMPESVQELNTAVQDKFGRCDVLVNNASIFQPWTTVEEMSFELWRKFISTNLDGTFLMCKAFLSDLKASGTGRVINIGSGMCWTTIPAAAHYYASKMGIIGFTRGLANELGEFNATANVVAPGLIRTEGSEVSSKEIFDLAPSFQAVKRLGMPDDMTGIISFLASEDSRFITGQTIVCDGGATRL